MNILAIDTCLDACQAAVCGDHGVLAVRSESMSRGHQERLAPMVAEAMAEAGLAFDALDRIAVTIGPGSFTGLRVGLAFAKGLALATGADLVGVGALEALAGGEAGESFVAAAIDARRGQIYLQAFSGGHALMAPDVLPLEIAAARLAELRPSGRVDIVGSGAPLLDGLVTGARILPRAAPDPVALARLAQVMPLTPARPLYLRAPDAKLPGGLDPPA